jgi:ribosomal protein S12 methylthiotransferase accessory factor
MDATVDVVGAGPAAEAVRTALADAPATVRDRTPDALGDGFAVVVAPAGADAHTTADRATDRWLAVETGGVGGHGADVDAAATLFDDVRFADLRARVASHATEQPVGDPPAAARRLAGAVAGRLALAALDGTATDGRLVELAGTTTRERRVSPTPTGPPERTPRRTSADLDADDAATRAERAVDDRVGLVEAVGEEASYPAPYYLARLADTGAFADAAAPRLAAGVAEDWDAAYTKAVGEALERYAAGAYRRSWLQTAPAAERPGAVPLSRFVTPDDRPDPSPDEAVPWVVGERLTDGASVSLPAEAVLHPPPEERHLPAITTGLGVWTDGVGALRAGLAEVLERDATTVAWYSTYEPLGLTVSDPTFDRLARRVRSEGLTVTPLLVTVDVDVPVVACAVHRDPDGEWPRFAVGSAADLDGERAATAALCEAVQNWTELDRMGRERAAEAGGEIGSYADFPAAARAFVDPSTTTTAAAVGPDEPPSRADALAALVERANDAGLTPYATRLTTPGLDAAGFEAVRVVVPEAQPLFTDDPFFGERARTVPRALGYEPRLDRSYHPYP